MLSGHSLGNALRAEGILSPCDERTSGAMVVIAGIRPVGKPSDILGWPNRAGRELQVDPWEDGVWEWEGSFGEWAPGVFIPIFKASHLPGLSNHQSCPFTMSLG